MKQTYKEFTILVKFGEGVDIIKHIRGKDFILYSRNFYFSKADEAINRACVFIDGHSDLLNKKFKTQFIEFSKKVYEKRNVFAITKIDIWYFIKCHETIMEKVKNGESV